MQNIALSAVPNQSFSVSLDGSIYAITLQTTINVMCATVYRNDILVISGLRLTPNALLLPYRYLTEGNFLMTTLNNEYPWWENFNVTNFLYFASAQELIEFQNAGN